MVVPFIEEIKILDVEEALKLMEEQKLIRCYQDSNDRSLIQILDWWQWQTGLKYKAPSHYEAPEGWEDKQTQRDESGKFKTEVIY